MNHPQNGQTAKIFKRTEETVLQEGSYRRELPMGSFQPDTKDQGRQVRPLYYFPDPYSIVSLITGKYPFRPKTLIKGL